ncbi:MAG: hypothetical protein R3C05_26200 [Pirellulaceae bacterium]
MPTNFVQCLAFSPDSQRLVVGNYTHIPAAPGPVYVCDVASRKVIHSLEGHRLNVLYVAVTPDGKKIISAGDDGSVRIWEMP